MGGSIGFFGVRYGINATGTHYVTCTVPGTGLRCCKTFNSQPNMSDQVNQTPAFGFGIEKTDLPENTDPRCPTVLLLDVSGSMAGKPLKELQDGLNQYIDELAADSLAKRRVDAAIITFGGKVDVAHAFAAPTQYAIPTLVAGGDTPMGAAVVKGIDLLRERKMELTKQGIQQYRAWVFLITDGGPTDDGLPVWDEALQRVKEGEEKKSFLFFAVGVEGANMDKLKLLSPTRPPLQLAGLRFRDLFQWLSASQKAVSTSKPGDSVVLPPVNWGSITT